MYVELFEDIVDEDGTDSLYLVGSVLAHVDIFFVLLVLDIAEYLFHDILHRDDTSSSSVFVEDECDMTARLLELLEEVIEWLCEGDLHDLLEGERSDGRISVSLALQLERFTERDHVLDVVRVLTCDREP